VTDRGLVPGVAIPTHIFRGLDWFVFVPATEADWLLAVIEGAFCEGE
jgi:hypothetical protein